MKKNILLILSSFAILTSIIIFSCKKEENLKKTNVQNSLDNSNQNHVGSRDIADLTLPEDATEEMTRVFNDIQNANYVLSITANPNYGIYCSTCLSDTYLNGVTEINDDISLKINSTNYIPDNNGQFLITNSAWQDLYDSDVDVEIKSGTTTLKSTTMHAPKRCLVNRLGTNGIISRTGNTLNWTPDSNNSVGYVIIYYYLFDSNNEMLENDAELVVDDGSFSIDNIISDNNVSTIYFQVIRGNTTSTTVNGEKLLFIIESIDHHRYQIN